MLQSKPPVVTIMGHVDHGKTTLLDKIRRSNIVAKESGGITQHIGAYQVSFKTKEGDINKITFIDTPGHAAFAQMRARGAQVTDFVVLVVAADEGVQEQTKESLAHIKNAKVPFLVAITKIDLAKEKVNPVKEELAEIDVVSEEYGGQVTVIPVSGKTGEGIDNLLEMLVLMGKLGNLKADPEAPSEGVVIESRLDHRRGPIGTVLVKKGTFRLRDTVWLGNQSMKIKAMFDDQGKSVIKAVPSQPVGILGFDQVPQIGSLISSSPRTSSEAKKDEKKEDKQLDEKTVFAEKKKKLPLVVKSDVQGTLEAILNSLPEEVKLVHAGVGEVSDSDIFLAQTAKAKVLAFRVKISSAIARLAEENGVEVKSYPVIYDLLDEVDKSVLRMLEPDIEREIVGKAEVVAEFKIDKKRVAGCRVLEGEISRALAVTIKRETEVLGETKITSMRHLKQDIQIAQKGQEFGAIFSPYIDFKIGDVIITYKS